jgi:hypothetical protein
MRSLRLFGEYIQGGMGEAAPTWFQNPGPPGEILTIVL